MILLPNIINLINIRFTRMSGDDPIQYLLLCTKNQFYPHERGWSIPKIVRLKLLLCFTRMSGDDPVSLMNVEVLGKFYPHERGWSFKLTKQKECTNVLPAWAGMILVSNKLLDLTNGFTRMSGDDPTFLPFFLSLCAFYPHERGWS